MMEISEMHEINLIEIDEDEFFNIPIPLDIEKKNEILIQQHEDDIS